MTLILKRDVPQVVQEAPRVEICAWRLDTLDVAPNKLEHVDDVTASRQSNLNVLGWVGALVHQFIESHMAFLVMVSCELYLDWQALSSGGRGDTLTERREILGSESGHFQIG